MRTALIDGDIIAYEIGFISETKLYNVDGKVYEYISDAVKALDGRPRDLIDIEVYPMTERATARLVRDHINSIVKRSGASRQETYLTGKGNFREWVATITKYKGTRHGARPYHYQFIRDTMVKEFGAITIEGAEADDALSIRGTDSRDNIICSRDKDLRQVAGLHYSWKSGQYQPERPTYEISEIEGWRNLYSQMLTGDTVDNIFGVPSIGEVKAEKLLKGCVTREEMFGVVQTTYNNVYGSVEGEGGYIHYTSWDGKRMWKTVDEVMQEMFSLLWMLRYEEECPGPYNKV